MAVDNMNINGIDTDRCLCHSESRVMNTREGCSVWCNECLPIPSEYANRFGKFNCFNPVQSEAFRILQENPRASLVAASGTGTGKSAIAEMAIIRYFENVNRGVISQESLIQQYIDDGFSTDEARELAVEETSTNFIPDGKVLVLQPLKALAHEKSEDWKKKFPELRVCSLTSDEDLGFGAERNSKMMDCDIVVCSYEMLDSMSRKPSVYTYLNYVGLLIVDEIHELSDRCRGGGLDGAITRFLKYRTNIGFKTQVVGLSATFENTNDLKGWLETFVPDLHVIYKDFSPIKARVNRSISYYGFGGREEAMLSEIYKMASLCDGPILAMVLSKPSVRKITKALNEGPFGDGCAKYHFGDLSVDERRTTEEEYRQGEFRFLIATPTLLAGVNLPCQGIVLDISYFNTELFETDVLPIQKINQARGRVGRLPYYNEGIVQYVCDGRVSITAENRIREANNVRGTLFYSIDSVINAEVDVSPTTPDELIEWYKITYSKFSNSYTDDEVEEKIYDTLFWLLDNEFIQGTPPNGEENSISVATAKGAFSARLMVSPKFIQHILNSLKLYEKSNVSDNMVLDNVFLHFWSHPFSEVNVNSNKLAALYKFNAQQAKDRVKSKRGGEYDWIKKIRVAIQRLTPFVEKYANLQQRSIWVAVCNHHVPRSVEERIASGWAPVV